MAHFSRYKHNLTARGMTFATLQVASVRRHSFMRCMLPGTASIAIGGHAACCASGPLSTLASSSMAGLAES